MVKNIVTAFDIIFALGLVATVLLQSGKSAGLSGSIAGASEAIFGKKKGLDELFEKMSTILAIGFMILTLTLALM
ncbi:MAG: preprotein translocase subunit SecG [Acidobacteriota bacterium]